MQSVDLLRPCQPMDAVATVLSSQLLTPTIKSIWLQLDSSDFRFLPGQAVWPRFERDGTQFSKIYSIASSPSQCPQIELCVSRVGWSSAYLQDLTVGNTISLRGPYGLLTLAERPRRPRLYVAEGSGIAPLKSHLDWLAECRYPHPVWLVQSNPETPDQLPYRAHWRSLQQKWPAFRYIEAIETKPESVLMREVTAGTLDLTQVDVDLCAVGDRVTQIVDTVMALGADPGRVRSEMFFAF